MANANTTPVLVPGLPIEFLEGLRVDDLRSLCRSRFADSSGLSAIVTMTKAELIDALQRGTLDAPTPTVVHGGMDEDRVGQIATEVFDAKILDYTEQFSDSIDAKVSKAAGELDATLSKVAADTLGELEKVVSSTVPDAVASYLEENPPAGASTTLTINRPGFDPVTLDGQHKQFEELLTLIATKENVYLPGPAGSGKTTAARNVAKALGYDFYSISLSNQTPVSALLGYQTATGDYVRTPLRDAFEGGGVFLFDEVDAANSNTLSVVNMLLDVAAGETAAFPDGMVERAGDETPFVAIAGANTIGNGANRQYSARNVLDGATIDRFGFLEWGYDERLELQVVSSFCGALAKGSAHTICAFVQTARRASDGQKLGAIVSPRAGIRIAKFLSAGLEWDRAVDIGLFGKLSPEVARKLRDATRDNATAKPATLAPR